MIETQLNSRLFRLANLPTSFIPECSTLQDFLYICSEAGEGDFNEQDLMGGFAEFYFRKFGSRYGIAELTPTNKVLGFTGKNTDGENIAAFPIYVNHDELTVNNGQLSKRTNLAFTNGEQEVDFNSLDRMFAISNVTKVNDIVLELAPTHSDKLIYVLSDEVNALLKETPSFFQEFVDLINKFAPAGPVKTTWKAPRPHQAKALAAMQKHNIGRIIEPPATGKSHIMAEDCLTVLRTNKGKPTVIVSVAPTILLTYQLQKTMFYQVHEEFPDIQYVNLSSGEPEEKYIAELETRLNQVGEKPRKFISTLSTRDIKSVIGNPDVPVLISSTYNSAHKLLALGIEFDVIYFDESHHLIVGTYRESDKKKNLTIPAKRKYFLTATQCEEMKDETVFGSLIQHGSHKERVEGGEIVPAEIFMVNFKGTIVKYNAVVDATEQDMYDDVNWRAEVILSILDFEKKRLQECSGNTSRIAPKALATMENSEILGNVLESDAMKNFVQQGSMDVLSLTTKYGYYDNGFGPKTSQSKIKCLRDLQELDVTDPLLMLHIEMINEGVDVPSMTCVIHFGGQNERGFIQELGRAQRLHPDDRNYFYENGKHMEKMVKPNCAYYFVMNSKDAKSTQAEILRIVEMMRTNGMYVPTQFRTLTRTGTGIKKENPEQTTTDLKELDYVSTDVYVEQAVIKEAAKFDQTAEDFLSF